MKTFFLATLAAFALYAGEDTYAQPALSDHAKQSQNMKVLLKKEVTDVLEMKNGDKILGRVTGSTSTATLIFNIDTCEDEIVPLASTAKIRKPNADELKKLSDEIIDQGRGDEITDVFLKKRESAYGKSQKTYEEDVRSAQQARINVDKELKRARYLEDEEKRREEEAEWRRSGYGRLHKVNYKNTSQ